MKIHGIFKRYTFYLEIIIINMYFNKSQEASFAYNCRIILERNLPNKFYDEDIFINITFRRINMKLDLVNTPVKFAYGLDGDEGNINWRNSYNLRRWIT